VIIQNSDSEKEKKMSNVMRLGDTEAAMQRLEEKARENSALTMKDCGHVLRLMSSIDRPGDERKHSPCLFCSHKGKESCPNGAIQKFELCQDYTPHDETPKTFDIRMVMYLQGIHADQTFGTVRRPRVAA
jgi:hypothetical protein